LGDLTENTGITRLKRWHGRVRLTSFNDTGHLGPRPGAVSDALGQGHAGLTLIRHGQTRANVERRWQGQSDWGLDEVGRSQANALANWYGRPDRVVSSPLGRAIETARTLSPDPEILEGLVELGFGTWEGLTMEEVRATDSVLYGQIFKERRDLPRGSTGESWAQMAHRIRGAIESIDPAGGQLTAVVTHGAAIRAYLANLAGRGWSAAGDWDTPANTSVTHLVLEDRGPRIVDFSSAIHLETMDLQASTESPLADPHGAPTKDVG
jgi:broad specificity phosphatase PhoE